MEKQKNQMLLDYIFPKEAFDYLFRERDILYEYEDFYDAVAQYPAFCGEYNSESRHRNLRNEVDACKRELATLFAHITYESGGHSSLPNIYAPVVLDGLKYPEDDFCIYWFEDGFGDFCQYTEDISELGMNFPGDPD